METLPQPSELSGSPPAVTASCPRWVMLNCYSNRRDSSVGDRNTAVVCRTSTGWPIRFSFLFAAPPTSSPLYYGWAGRAPGEDARFNPPSVIAAHGDSILLKMLVPRACAASPFSVDHFLYDTGAAAGGGGPPSALLLPACYFPMQFQQRGRAAFRDSARRMGTEDTGLLRRGDGELLVVQLEVTFDEPYDTAELCVLRPGGDWELKRAVPIVSDEGAGKGGGEPVPWRDTDAVVAIGDRFLCWVNYFCGFLLCDMAEAAAAASPRLRRVQLPVPPPEGIHYTGGYDRPSMRRSRNMGAAGDGAARFVSVDPRCCCGGPGASTCARSSFAFTVTTWTMAIAGTDGPPMTWAKDGVIDCEELWAQPGYQGLPRVRLEYPVVSSDNPDVVCFMVCEDCFAAGEEEKAWTVEVDTRSKALLSVVRCAADLSGCHLPAKLRW